MTPPVVQIKGLDYRYGPDQPLILRDLSFTLHRGQRCLVVGANGVGKTTVLRLLAGKHIIAEDKVRVLGRPAFHDTSLADRVSFIGGPYPGNVDLVVAEMLEHRKDADPARLTRLIGTLDIDVNWHLNRLSDGQRRRVQILLHLVRPSALLLLDEVTTDLDLVARANLLAFLKDESEQRGTAIAYATHIFDGLEDWATHIALLEQGRVVFTGAVDRLKELDELRDQGISSPLYRLVERWLRYGYRDL